MEVGRKALDISFRAIDAYRKTLLVDKVTSNDERSPPVYLLNEISDILRSCSLDLTHEIVEYTFRRLRHQNPQVKYKVLRFIKYTVNRAGSAAYRKELQSYSASIRELFNFQGQVDPLKGNALNQAVRDAAHEAIKAIFSSDASLPTSKSINNRIEGFGNGNFSKSFVSSYGSAATDETERESLKCYDGNGYFDSVTCEQDHERELQEIVNYKPNRESEKVSSPEEELLDKTTASQGLRLQPTHECLQFFLSSAKTLDSVRIALALKAKLQTPSWQVRLKALCLLQALLHQKDASLLQAIKTDEGDFYGCVQECLLSPQITLRKKANEVLDSLGAKNHKGSPNMLVDDTLSEIKSCDKDFFALKPRQPDDRDARFLSPSPATTSDAQQMIDLLSFQNDDSQLKAAETSPNSVMDDPFDGMYIYGSNESAKLHMDDLLSGGWSDNNMHPIEGNAKTEANYMFLRTAPKSNAITQNQHKIPALDNIFIPDIAAMGSTTTGKSALSSLYTTDSKGNIPGLQNLNSLYMFPSGMARSLQFPGGTQGFEFGTNNATTNVNGKIAAGKHALGDTYFKEFGLSS